MVEIPLELLGLEASEMINVEAPIESIRFSGDLKGTFYLDDIRLVTVARALEATAVLEEHTTTLLQSFTLAQNYPNPFNL